jgi:hypothetical protein
VSSFAFVRDRQFDHKSGAAADLALECNHAPVFVYYDRSRYRQTLACTAAHRFGCEKWVEYLGPDLFGYATSSVTDRDPHALTTLPRMDANGTLLPCAVHHFRNRMGSVDQQVEKDLI